MSVDKGALMSGNLAADKPMRDRLLTDVLEACSRRRFLSAGRRAVLGVVAAVATVLPALGVPNPSPVASSIAPGAAASLNDKVRYTIQSL